MKITFLGAAREVTGSCYLIEACERSFLVDYGMYQGGADADRKNRARPRFDPSALNFVLLTHAHIDHSGLLPRLVAAGFNGPIYATEATCDLLRVMLLDAAHVQEREAEQNGANRSPGPLYTATQAEAALRLLQPIAYDQIVDLGHGLACRFRDAGHILGSAVIELWAASASRKRKIVFSGDIGQRARPVVRDAAIIEYADVLVIESTYGNRLHKSMSQTEDEIVEVFTTTLGAGRGNIIIPAFAVGRTQEILCVLSDLVQRRRISQKLRVYVDSPMAAKATEITLKHLDITDHETRTLIAAGDKRPIDIEFTESVYESKWLGGVQSGAVIISASGMCDAGRIRRHLRHNLPRPECAVVFTGFQAAGTLGRKLVDGAREVRLFGEMVPVRARICTIGGLSAHADQAGLLAWMRGFLKPPARTFVVHGEASTALGFAENVRTTLGWQAEAPRAGQVYEIGDSESEQHGNVAHV